MKPTRARRVGGKADAETADCLGDTRRQGRRQVLIQSPGSLVSPAAPAAARARLRRPDAEIGWLGARQGRCGKGTARGEKLYRIQLSPRENGGPSLRGQTRVLRGRRQGLPREETRSRQSRQLFGQRSSFEVVGKLHDVGRPGKQCTGASWAGGPSSWAPSWPPPPPGAPGHLCAFANPGRSEGPTPRVRETRASQRGPEAGTALGRSPRAAERLFPRAGRATPAQTR